MDKVRHESCKLNNRMRSYHKLKTFIAAVITLYAGIGLILAVTNYDDPEIFPVFSWTLFTHIPNRVQDYGLRITALGDQEFHPPLAFEKAGKWFKAAGSSAAYKSIQKLGAAITDEDSANIEKWRELIEHIYFGGNSQVGYEIVWRSFNPMEKWRDGRHQSLKRIAVFETGDR